MNQLTVVLLPVGVLLISVLTLALWGFLRATTEGEHKASLRGIVIGTLPILLTLLVGSWTKEMADQSSSCKNPNVKFRTVLAGEHADRCVNQVSKPPQVAAGENPLFE